MWILSSHKFYGIIIKFLQKAALNIRSVILEICSFSVSVTKYILLLVAVLYKKYSLELVFVEPYRSARALNQKFNTVSLRSICETELHDIQEICTALMGLHYQSKANPEI